MKTSENKFYLGSNGVTIKCINAVPGETGIVDEVEYECADNELLKKRIRNGSDITRLCTSLVTDMTGLFKFRNFNEPIGHWDVSNVRSMKWMFECSQFNQPIGEWDVSSVTDMKGMFYDTPFNQYIGNWNVSNVTDMSRMFQFSKFNQPIEFWDVNNVRDMTVMFQGSWFNQDISDWCVGNIKSVPKNFSTGSLLSLHYEPQWGSYPDESSYVSSLVSKLLPSYQ